MLEEKGIAVKFMAINEEGQIASGIVKNCPSVDAMLERLEELNVNVIYAEEATQEEIDEESEKE